MLKTQSKVTARIIDCQAYECSFNHRGECRAVGINIGGPEPLCDTFIRTESKGGNLSTTAIVGACKVEVCQFNKALECMAEEIQVVMNNDQAICGTYQWQ